MVAPAPETVMPPDKLLLQLRPDVLRAERVFLTIPNGAAGVASSKPRWRGSLEKRVER